MKHQIFAIAFVALSGGALFPALSGCSGKSQTSPPSASCDPSQCAPGNECISDGKETKCRLVCALKGDGTGGQSTCPFNYHCADGPKPYCAPDATAYTKSGKGLWGASCSPTGGFDNNPSCDSNQNFWCYAQTPVDGAAFCTQYQCASDADCRGGWWCATINSAPNATQAARSVGQTTTACLPRTYCSPCKSDIDCPADKGARQHCVSDNGGGKYCAPECGQDSQCNQEAKCVQNDEASAKVCVPNAGVCVGDGGMCSPCRSDADCKGGGACAFSSYSTEHFCVTPSSTPCGITVAGTCTTDANGVAKAPLPTCKLASSCPPSPVQGGNTSCTFAGSANPCPDGTDSGGNPNCTVPHYANAWPSIPPNFCYGTVSFGTGQELAHVPGCYTARR